MDLSLARGVEWRMGWRGMSAIGGVLLDLSLSLSLPPSLFLRILECSLSLEGPYSTVQYSLDEDEGLLRYTFMKWRRKRRHSTN